MTANFHLLQDFPISFKVTPGGSITFNINLKEEQIFPCDKSYTSWRTCNILREMRRNKGVDWIVQVKMLFPRNGRCHPRCMIDGPCIKDMLGAVGFGVNMTVTLDGFATPGVSTPIYVPLPVDVAPQEPIQPLVGPSSASSPRHFARPSLVMICGCTSVNGKKLAQLEGRFQEVQNTPFMESKASYAAKLSIRISGPVTLHENLDGTCNEKGDDSVSFNRRILNESFDTDMEIIARNGMRIPCHRIFLTGHSKEFKRMLTGSSEEDQKKYITMDDMGEIGVKSLLSFLYYGDVGIATTDYSICVELLEASEKYGLEKLQQEMISILRSRDDAWFNVESTLKLFVLTRTWPHCADIKTLAARILKLKQAQLEECESFGKLFTGNPDAAKDLFYST